MRVAYLDENGEDAILEFKTVIAKGNKTLILDGIEINLPEHSYAGLIMEQLLNRGYFNLRPLVIPELVEYHKKLCAHYN